MPARVVLAILIAGLLCTPRAAARDGWVRVETPHVVLYSEIDEARTRHFARMLEAFRAVIAKLEPELEVERAPRIAVYLFRDGDRLREALPEFPRGYKGVHFAADEGCRTVAAANGSALPTLYHEYVHHLLHTAGRGLPRWYHEGLSAYYATLLPEGGDYVVGRADPSYRMILEYVGSVSLRDLLGTWDPENNPMLYGTSWGLVHFLRSDESVRGKALAFATALASGKDPDAASREGLGFPLDELQERFRAHLRQYQLPHQSVPAAEIAVPEPGATVALERKEEKALLADLAGFVASRKRAPGEAPATPSPPAEVELVPIVPDSPPPTSPVAVAAPPENSSGWSSLATPHFRMWSEVGKVPTRGAARQLETMLAVVDTISGGLDDFGEPLDVFVFTSRDSMARFYPRRGIEDKIAGLFTLRGDERALLILGDTVGLYAANVTYHELTHALTQRRCPTCPAWFREGFAEYYATLRIDGDVAEVGRSFDAHVRKLLETNGRGTTWVLTQEAVNPHTLSPEATEDFYARSWALVFYLLNTGRPGREALARLLERSAAGADAETAVRESFGLSREELDRTIADFYMTRPFLPFSRIPLDRVSIPDVGEPAPAEPAVAFERLGALVRIVRGSKDPDLLLDLHRKSLDADPEYVPARLGLARAFETLDRDDEAATEYERALREAPEDVGVARAAGIFLARRAAAPEECERARSILERSLVARPTDADALFAYGSTWIDEPDAEPTRGIEALRASGRIDPGEPATWFNLTVLLLRAHRREEGEAVVREHAGTLDAKSLATLREMLATAKSEESAPTPASSSAPRSGGD